MGPTRILIYALILLALLTVAAFTKRANATQKERFEGPLSIVHVTDAKRTSLVLDPERGPSPDLPDIAAASLGSLRGLDVEPLLGLSRLVEDGEDLERLAAAATLLVGDAAQLSHFADRRRIAEDGGAPKGRMTLAIVAPLVETGSMRCLHVLTPVAPAGDARAHPPSLIRHARSGAKVRAHCGTALEASLFRVAWAVASGGSEPPPGTIVEHFGGGGRVAAARAAARDDTGLAVVPVWCCDGAKALTDVEKAWPRGHAAHAIYHPSDDESAEQRVSDAAPHVLAAVAPAISTAAIRVEQQDAGATEGAPATMMMLVMLTSPALILLVQTPGASSELATAMARRISERLLDKEGRALLTFYQSHGLSVLLPEASPTSGGDVREGFVEQAVSPSVELVPAHAVRASFSVRLYDEAGEGPWRSGVREARFDAQEPVIDGVKLRPGDRVTLTKQERPGEQNGTYFVVEDERGRRLLQSPPTLAPQAGYRSWLEKAPGGAAGKESGAWRWRFRVPIPKGVADTPAVAVMRALRSGDVVAWLPLDGAPHGTVEDVTPGSIDVVFSSASVLRSASPVAAKRDRDTLHPLAACSLGPDVAFRELCESRGGSWDRPCKRDADCPFVEGGGGGDGERGRCLEGGRCEAPVGGSIVGWAGRGPERPLCRCGEEEAGQATLRGASRDCCRTGGKLVYELERV